MDDENSGFTTFLFFVFILAAASGIIYYYYFRTIPLIKYNIMSQHPSACSNGANCNINLINGSIISGIIGLEPNANSNQNQNWYYTPDSQLRWAPNLYDPNDAYCMAVPDILTNDPGTNKPPSGQYDTPILLARCEKNNKRMLWDAYKIVKKTNPDKTITIDFDNTIKINNFKGEQDPILFKNSSNDAFCLNIAGSDVVNGKISAYPCKLADMDAISWQLRKA
jgi:hypothetical protein